MNPFHDYLSQQLLKHLQKRRVVTWYDPDAGFQPYIDTLVASAVYNGDIPQVAIQALSTYLIQFDESFFQVRILAEPLVSVDDPAPMLIYVPGASRDLTGSVLMELERAGECFEWKLKSMARFCLRQTMTDGVIDDLLAPEHVTYTDVVHFLEQRNTGETASMLKVIFGTSKDAVSLLASWLADDSQDGVIGEKDAIPELIKLIETRLGLAIEEDTALSDARRKTLQYVLVNEFRSDLSGAPPESINMISKLPSRDHLDRIRQVAETLREGYAEAYVTLANQVELGLALSGASLSADDLGGIDTFQFEEKLLIDHCADAISSRDYDQAMDIVEGRSRSFWVEQDVVRQAQWEACRLMAELGRQISAVRPELEKMKSDPDAWAQAYTAPDGWHQIDLTHRTLEAWVAKMDEEPEAEQALGVVRKEYETLLQQMTVRFAKALQQAGWTLASLRHQTHIYPDVVKASGSKQVAYFFVDAMRYEMGVELARQFQDGQDLSLQPAVAALPTITPVGMAALLPGASASFSVDVNKGKLTTCIEDVQMPNIQARLKFLKAKVPDVAEMPIGKLLQSSQGRLKKTVDKASLVVVRSQEIDFLGEGNDDWLARQVMDTTIGNIARAVRKLAGLGIEQFVITADHGHLFSSRKEEDMRMDPPGGDTASIHRRCWMGRGGQTPSGTVRVMGTELGYNTDLDVIFPTGTAVFSTQGGLSYHHGGISLQEMLVPVISLRFPASVEEMSSLEIALEDCPHTLTNRTFGVKVAVASDLFQQEPVILRLILLSGGEQVGQTGMAIDADFDRTTGCVAVKPGTTASIGLMLIRDDCETVQIVVQDPKTDAVLAQSADISVNLGI